MKTSVTRWPSSCCSFLYTCSNHPICVDVIPLKPLPSVFQTVGFNVLQRDTQGEGKSRRNTEWWALKIISQCQSCLRKLRTLMLTKKGRHNKEGQESLVCPPGCMCPCRQNGEDGERGFDTGRRGLVSKGAGQCKAV